MVLGYFVAAAGVEDLFGVVALGANVDALVLDDTENRDADLLEHLETLLRRRARSCVVTMTAPVTYDANYFFARAVAR